ncbi:MAG: hypothetical protein KatS3mg015_0817 [Fimbriimonadales bacterium]|nr:MAG: hypothetical protein KatS3mg015_0817 [Fimbriimonadales bacterium]
MLRSFRSRLGWFALLVLVAAAYWATGWLADFSRYDPFARYRTADYLNALGPDVGSRVEGARVKVYSGEDLTLSFRATRVDIRRDRARFTVFDLNDGRVYDKAKPALAFAAGGFVYDTVLNSGSVFGGLTAWNADLVLRTDKAEFDTGRGELRSGAPVTGRYEDGRISAQSVVWAYKEKSGRAEEILWEGSVQDQRSGQVRRLRLRGKTWEVLSNPRRQIFYEAEAVDQDQFVRAKKITWFEEEDRIVAEGDVEYVGPEAILQAPKVVVYRKEERAVATDGVRLIVKPEKEKGKVAPPPAGLPPAEPELPPGLKQPGGGSSQGQANQQEEARRSDNIRKYPIVVTADKVEYWYTEGRRRAEVTGKPKARQDLPGGEWREIAAVRAVYDLEAETLTLLSGAPGAQDVRLRNSAGDDFVAEEVVVSTVEGNETIRGKNVSGVMPIREEEVKRQGTGGGSGGGEPFGALTPSYGQPEKSSALRVYRA